MSEQKSASSSVYISCGVDFEEIFHRPTMNSWHVYACTVWQNNNCSNVNNTHARTYVRTSLMYFSDLLSCHVNHAGLVRIH